MDKLLKRSIKVIKVENFGISIMHLKLYYTYDDENGRPGSKIEIINVYLYGLVGIPCGLVGLSQIHLIWCGVLFLNWYITIVDHQPLLLHRCLIIDMDRSIVGPHCQLFHVRFVYNQFQIFKKTYEVTSLRCTPIPTVT